MSYAEWNPATTYVQNDIVSYQGSLFVSLQTPNYNHNPSTATSFWAVQGGGGGVSKITAGTGISITPTGGIGNVTINATGSGVSAISAGNAGISIGGTDSFPTILNEGVLSLAAGSGISLTGATGNITVSATGGGGGKQWYNVYNQASAPILTNGLSLFWPVPSWPSNDIVQVLVVATFTALGQASPLTNDPSVFVSNFTGPITVNESINAGREWLATYLTPPSPSLPQNFNYTFMIPAGNGGSNTIAVTAFTQSIVGQASWSVYMFY